MKQETMEKVQELLEYYPLFKEIEKKMEDLKKAIREDLTVGEVVTSPLGKVYVNTAVSYTVDAAKLKNAMKEGKFSEVEYAGLIAEKLSLTEKGKAERQFNTTLLECSDISTTKRVNVDLA